jgi:hypothetical protein
VTDSASLKLCLCPEHEGDNPLPVSEFGRHRGRADGLTDWCRECRNRQAVRYRADNPEKVRATKRRYRAANPEKERARENRRRQTDPNRNRRWRQANPGKMQAAKRRWKMANPGHDVEAWRRLYQAVRETVFSHYGRVCACCGTTKKLTIDHVNGNGTAHRIALFGRNSESLRMYKWIIQQGFPEDFQVLCDPCNKSKGKGPACRLDHSN